MFVIVESVLAENLIHCEEILSQDALPIFPGAGYVAGDKHLNPEPRESDQSECNERAFLPHLDVLHVRPSSIAERFALGELANCLMKTAFPQLCAFCSSKSGSVSAMGIFQQFVCFAAEDHG
jgi:hypothetical protein